jgi:hypothetical protein
VKHLAPNDRADTPAALRPCSLACLRSHWIAAEGAAARPQGQAARVRAQQQQPEAPRERGAELGHQVPAHARRAQSEPRRGARRGGRRAASARRRRGRQRCLDRERQLHRARPRGQAARERVRLLVRLREAGARTCVCPSNSIPYPRWTLP